MQDNSRARSKIPDENTVNIAGVISYITTKVKLGILHWYDRTEIPGKQLIRL